MIVFKTTVGFVTQTFDTATGKCTHQEFVAGEQVDWEHGDEEIEEPDNCPDHPLEMVQPNEDTDNADALAAAEKVD